MAEGTTDPSGATAGPIYREVIEQQLAEEDSHKTSLEQRGATVITSSGGLVTLLLAIGAIVTSSQHYSPSPEVRRRLAFSVGAFGLAALAGISVNVPWSFRVLRYADPKRVIQPDWWGRAADPASRRVAEARLELLRTARGLNTFKGQMLFVANLLEAAAIILLVVTVVRILWP